MNRTTIDWRTLAVALLGAFLPGCVEPPPATAWDGFYCAETVEGVEFCVLSKEGPAAAWNKAAANGSLPIQLWADTPTSMTLDELVERGDHLRAWFSNIDTALAYVRDTKRNAESYKASLGGELAARLTQAKDRQAELVAAMPVDAIGRFKQTLTDKANTDKSPLVASLATDMQTMMAVTAIVEETTSQAAPLEAAYAMIAAQFTAYRESEADETAAYAALAKEASTASLNALSDVEQAIVTAAQEASKKPNMPRWSMRPLSSRSISSCWICSRACSIWRTSSRALSRPSAPRSIRSPTT